MGSFRCRRRRRRSSRVVRIQKLLWDEAGQPDCRPPARRLGGIGALMAIAASVCTAIWRWARLLLLSSIHWLCKLSGAGQMQISICSRLRAIRSEIPVVRSKYLSQQGRPVRLPRHLPPGRRVRPRLAVGPEEFAMQQLGTLEELPLAYRDGLSERAMVPLWPLMRDALPYDKPHRACTPACVEMVGSASEPVEGGRVSRRSKRPSAACSFFPIPALVSTSCARRRPSSSACR